MWPLAYVSESAMLLWASSNTSITKELVYIFLRRIIANHGFLRKIILDRDKLFILKFWQVLIAKIGTRTKLSIIFYS
jgi:hypothetical protein